MERRKGFGPIVAPLLMIYMTGQRDLSDQRDYPEQRDYRDYREQKDSKDLMEPRCDSRGPPMSRGAVVPPARGPPKQIDSRPPPDGAER
jgi:hypothetical protein